MVASPDPLLGARIKTERAEEHIIQLETAEREFRSVNPDVFSTYTEYRGSTRVICARIKLTLPFAWGTIIGDAVHNLRSALDLLTYQLVPPAKRSTNTMFPIFKSESTYESHVAGRINGSHPEVRTILDRLKPYKGGTDGFWWIHDIDIHDKHHVLLPVVGSIRDIALEHTVQGTPLYSWNFPDHVRCPVEDGAVLVNFVGGGSRRRGLLSLELPEVETGYRGTFFVAFSEPEVVKCQPILPTLRDLLALTRRTIDELAPHVV
jgi:hypothetical protein